MKENNQLQYRIDAFLERKIQQHPDISWYADHVDRL